MLKPWTRRLLLYAESTQRTRPGGETSARKEKKQNQHDKNHVFYCLPGLDLMENRVLLSKSTNFIISKELSAYSVAVNDCDVVIKPHHDKTRRWASKDAAFAIQHLSRLMLKITNPLDACDFLLQFFAANGWKIEEADVETFQPEL